MNTPLRRISIVVMAMFVALMTATTWVQFVQAPSLNADGRNTRTLYREYSSFRGPIVVDGQAVAWSEPVDDPFGYQRHYPEGPLFAHATGYYAVVHGRTGIERAENDVLSGASSTLFLRRLQDLVTGRQQQGAAVELTLDPAVQRAALDALGGQTGAVIALDPTTGAILAMVSTPGFDPNTMTTHDTAAAAATYRALLDDPAQPLINRAIAGDTYPPGSVFKLVTAAAALESGRFTAESVVPAPVELDLPQTSATIGNFGGSSCSPDGQTSLAEALRISCNTAFAQLGLDLGADALATQAEAFGFGAPLQIPLSAEPSRFPAEPDAPQTALSAIGQYEVRVTPLQVAMVSAAIANSGRLMQPYLVQTVRSPDLDVLSTTEPSELGRPISATTAASLRTMMTSVVETGTGRAAAIPGVAVAGKTGTAQTVTGDPTVAPHAWFTAFAPADNPQVAVAVVVEHGGSLGAEATGGQVAAPIARAVIQAVLAR